MWKALQGRMIQKTRRTGVLVGSKLKSEGSRDHHHHNRPQLNARENGALESSSASFLFISFAFFSKTKFLSQLSYVCLWLLSFCTVHRRKRKIFQIVMFYWFSYKKGHRRLFFQIGGNKNETISTSSRFDRWNLIRFQIVKGTLHIRWFFNSKVANWFSQIKFQLLKSGSEIK